MSAEKLVAVIPAIHSFGFYASTRDLCLWGYKHMVYFVQIYFDAYKVILY